MCRNFQHIEKLRSKTSLLKYFWKSKNFKIWRLKFLGVFWRYFNCLPTMRSLLYTVAAVAILSQVDGKDSFLFQVFLQQFSCIFPTIKSKSRLLRLIQQRLTTYPCKCEWCWGPYHAKWDDLNPIKIHTFKSRGHFWSI